MKFKQIPTGYRSDKTAYDTHLASTPSSRLRSHRSDQLPSNPSHPVPLPFGSWNSFRQEINDKIDARSLLVCSVLRFSATKKIMLGTRKQGMAIFNHWNVDDFPSLSKWYRGPCINRTVPFAAAQRDRCVRRRGLGVCGKWFRTGKGRKHGSCRPDWCDFPCALKPVLRKLKTSRKDIVETDRLQQTELFAAQLGTEQWNTSLRPCGALSGRASCVHTCAGGSGEIMFLGGDFYRFPAGTCKVSRATTRTRTSRAHQLLAMETVHMSRVLQLTRNVFWESTVWTNYLLKLLVASGCNCFASWCLTLSGGIGQCLRPETRQGKRSRLPGVFWLNKWHIIQKIIQHHLRSIITATLK